MKKFIYLFAIIGLIISGFPAQKAEACSFPPGVTFPTYQETLNAGGKISIVKPVASGQIVVATVQNYPSVMTLVAIPTQYVVLEGGYTSCSTMFDFSSNKYYVVIAPANDSFVIRPMTGGKQFVYAYDTLAQAQDAYDNFVAGQTPNPNPNPSNYTPVGYTLKYGMRGNDVKALQQALRDYISNVAANTPTVSPVSPIPITVDGIYGTQTVNLVKAFQTYTGLFPIDGIAGKMTQQKLSEQ